MDESSVLAHLRRMVARGWQATLDADREIRLRPPPGWAGSGADADHDPLTAMCRVWKGVAHPLSAWRDAARTLGIAPELAVRLRDASDGHRSELDLRAHVLDALGLPAEHID